MIRYDKIEFIDVLGNDSNIYNKDFDFNNNKAFFTDEDELTLETK